MWPPAWVLFELHWLKNGDFNSSMYISRLIRDRMIDLFESINRYQPELDTSIVVTELRKSVKVLHNLDKSLRMEIINVLNRVTPEAQNLILQYGITPNVALRSIKCEVVDCRSDTAKQLKFTDSMVISKLNTTITSWHLE